MYDKCLSLNKVLTLDNCIVSLIRKYVKKLKNKHFSQSQFSISIKPQNKRQFELFCAQWHLYGYQTRSVWKKEHPRLICRWLKNKPKVNILFNIWFVSSFIKGCASFSVQVLCFVYFLNSTLGGAVLRQIFVSCLRSTTTLSAGAAWSGAKPRFSLTKIIERHRIDYRTHASSAVFVYDAHSQ